MFGRHAFAIFIGIMAVFTLPVDARTLVINYPGMTEQEGLLQPSVLLGKPGFTLEGLVSSGKFPSRFSLAAAFPLFDQDTLRGSGWMWSVRAGETSLVDKPGAVFAAGHYYLEAGFGRGTSSPIFENRSGLRGYMEFTFRSEQPRLNADVGRIAGLLHYDASGKANFISVKIGAGSTLDAEGLVNQKPGNWGNRVQTQVYFPVNGHEGSVLSLMVEGFRLCPSQSWLCGWHLSFQHQYNTDKSPDFDEISDVGGLGVFMSYYRRDDFTISSRLVWPYVGNSVQKGLDAVPILHLLITKSF